ncbi:MAG: biotin transporter BioY [Peptococcaceae bacterium]|nr:biotin transporter BioY [Peptococcaceae bacterium]
MKFSTKEINRVGIFAALHVAAAMMLRYGGPAVVPFSLVPFMAFLAAFTLGGRLGALSLAVYALLGLMGVPVFARAPFGGLTYVLQPTFGFIIGFIVAAYFAGQFDINTRRGAALAMVVGVAVLYLVGVPYLVAVIRFYLGRPFTWQRAFEVAVAPFIVLDFVKVFVAVLLARAIKKRLPYISN